MKLLGSMTCAGSVVVLLYLICMVALKKSFGAKCRYRILVMALFFYLVPVQLGHYMDIAQDIVQDRVQDRMLLVDREGNRAYDISRKRPVRILRLRRRWQRWKRQEPDWGSEET